MSLVLHCSGQLHVNLSNTGVSWYAMCAPCWLTVQLQVSFSRDSVSCMLPCMLQPYQITMLMVELFGNAWRSTF